MASNLTTEASYVSNENSFDFSANDYSFDQDIQSCRANVVKPIAVTGLSLKFPQDATSTQSFNSMLMEGRCAVTEFPKDRINLDAFYSTDANRKDTFAFRGGHFIREDIAVFDAPFFSISPTEAEGMDPLQRGLLEICYRALENAGIPLQEVKGSKTSVHVGNFSNDWAATQLKDPQDPSIYAATGMSQSLLANRVSWFFDLRGPSFTLDAACSSSMMALDLACQGLQRGQSTMALVAGCNLIYDLQTMASLANMGFLSRDSRCFSFDERANGYGRGEGFGVVVLKLLADAVRDGDTIRAVIRSTSSNQDGRTVSGITQPSSSSQEQLIRDTYAKAGLDMKLTRYIEAHGTGTPIGDPVEISAIGAAFERNKNRDKSVFIGSVKANIGHLEGASGVAGIIKTILMLEQGLLFPIADLKTLNPEIDRKSLGLVFPRECIPWPNDGLRRASINSFGMGGANCHAVLDDACNFLRLKNVKGNHCTVKTPPQTTEICLGALGNRFHHGNESRSDLKPKLLVWSAADEKGIERLAEVYSKHFTALDLGREDMSTYMHDLAFTLTVRRSSLSWKSYVVAQSTQSLHELQPQLSKPVRSGGEPTIGFVFTGQGAQWWGMGHDLLDFPVFKDSLQKSEGYLKDLGCCWTLMDKFLQIGCESQIHEPFQSQSLCSALQIALVDLLQSFGVKPKAVVGHSSGEIAAAYCIGAISHQSALKLAYHRGLLASVLSESGKHDGAMASVGLSELQVQSMIDEVALRFGEKGLTTGCINSPKNVTVTGLRTQIEALVSLSENASIFVRKLPIKVAYHSTHMEAMTEEYQSLIQDIRPGVSTGEPQVMISSLTGSKISKKELLSEEYWCKNLLSPVRFSEALSNLCSNLDVRNIAGAPIDTLVEIGPHAALRAPIHEILRAEARETKVTYSSILIRNTPAVESILHTVGLLHCAGYSAIRMAEVNQSGPESSHQPMALPSLPEYPFDHSRAYWHESRLSKGYRLRKNPRLDLLGTPVPDWNPLDARWRNIIRMSELPWTEDHEISGSVVYPAAGMLVMAIEAIKQRTGEIPGIVGYRVKEVDFKAPIPIPLSDEGIETQFTLRSEKLASAQDRSWSEFRLYSLLNGGWVENCSGSIRGEYEETSSLSDFRNEGSMTANPDELPCGIQPNYTGKALDAQQMYNQMRDCGHNYGPAFQCLRSIDSIIVGEANAELRLFSWQTKDGQNPPQPHVIHPASLDGVFQLTFVALSQGGINKVPTMVPRRLQNMWISSSKLSYPSAEIIRLHSKVLIGDNQREASIRGLDSTNGDLQLLIEGLEMSIVGTSNSTASAERRLCYNLDWKPDIDLLDRVQTLQYCQEKVPDLPEPVQFYQDLKFILFSYISESLVALRNNPPASLAPHIQKYVIWMQMQMDRYDAQDLPCSEPGWKSLLKDELFKNSLASRLEKESKQAKFFIEVGRNLGAIIHGTVDPLGLMFGATLARDYYHEVSNNVTYNMRTSRYLDALAHKNPGMSILEVGAGTGGMTSHVIKALTSHGDNEIGTPRYAQYDYTDISPSFFQVAQETFVDQNDRMRFKVLDIENDATRQGFREASYDLVIAASVLHATQSLDRTMSNIRKLLKVGGKLMLLEVTEPDKLGAGFAFGLLPGWWLGADDGREWSPCVSVTQWDEVASRNGFTKANTVFQDYQNEWCQETSIMVYTALDSTLTSPALRDMVIVADKSSPIQKEVADQVQRQLLLTMTSHCEILTLPDVLKKECLREIFCISLLELGVPLLRDMEMETYRNLQVLLTSAQNLVWVNSKESNKEHLSLGMAEGLRRVLHNENPGHIFVTLLLRSDVKIDGSALYVDCIVKALTATANRKTDSQYEPEYVEEDGFLKIGRLIENRYLDHHLSAQVSPIQSQVQQYGHGPPVVLSIKFPGLLDTLHFIADDEYTKPLAANEIEVEVKAVGLNFMDLLIALGRLDRSYMGTECAGVVTRVGKHAEFDIGDRVMLGYVNTFKTFARCPWQCAVKIPEHLSFPEAAALPTTLSTAYHALHEVAHLKKGESILIHSAAGGTGQSAIQIAQRLGAAIYATVGSAIKKQLIMEHYGIPESHIFYSRDASFAKDIKRVTKGIGVDVVLNSLAGDSLIASWECIAPFGRFIEIGKKDILAHQKLPMFPFARNVSFSAVDMATMGRERPAHTRKVLESVVNLVEAGSLHASRPLQVYRLSEVEQAFRHMQSGKNMGKLVVEINKEEQVPTLLNTKPSFFFDPKATYLIAGGLGGIGLAISRWMAGRGAKNLLLLSRSGILKEGAIDFKAEMAEKGVRIHTPACNVTDVSSLQAILEQDMQRMPPIKGCIQASVVMQDSIFNKMPFESWKATVDPKVQGSFNLHRLLPKGMDFFILLSSVSGIVGKETQASYAAGNSYMDALARYRISIGEKAASIDLGIMEEIGFLANSPKAMAKMKAPGNLIPLFPEDLFALLDYHCNPSLEVLSSLRCQTIVGIETPANITAKGYEIPTWMTPPMFRHLFQIDSTRSRTVTLENGMNIAECFKSIVSLPEAGDFVTEKLIEKLAKSMSIAKEDMHVDKPMRLFGVDSLVAVELRNWFAKHLKADITVFDLMGESTFGEIGLLAARRSAYRQAT